MSTTSFCTTAWPAWQDDFTGYVVDYGTLPEQTERVFALDSARRSAGAGNLPGAGPDGAIQAGLEKLVATYLAMDFRRWCGPDADRPAAGGHRLQAGPRRGCQGTRPAARR